MSQPFPLKNHSMTRISVQVPARCGTLPFRDGYKHPLFALGCTPVIARVLNGGLAIPGKFPNEIGTFLRSYAQNVRNSALVPSF